MYVQVIHVGSVWMLPQCSQGGLKWVAAESPEFCFFTFHVSHLFYIYNSVFLPDRSDSLFFLLFFFFVYQFGIVIISTFLEVTTEIAACLLNVCVY